MGRLLRLILVTAVLFGCGQKGPLVLPEEAKRKPAQPPTHDVPPVQERPR